MHRRTRPTIALLALVPIPAAAAAARADGATASLTVTVDNVRDGRGHIRIGVCTRAEFLSERCAFHAVVPAAAGRVVATIAVAPGLYAVAAFQDSIDAGHLRRSLLGIPEDGTGFSRDPSLRFGPPSFDASAFRLGPGAHAVTVRLHYF